MTYRDTCAGEPAVMPEAFKASKITVAPKGITVLPSTNAAVAASQVSGVGIAPGGGVEVPLGC